MITKFDVMKPDKVNKDGMLLSENCINGSDLLFVCVSLLVTVMLSHSLAPPKLLYQALYPYLKELE